MEPETQVMPTRRRSLTVERAIVTWQTQEALDDIVRWLSEEVWSFEDVARSLLEDNEQSAIYRALDLAASDPRFELAQQSGWLQQVRDAVTELL